MAVFTEAKWLSDQSIAYLMRNLRKPSPRKMRLLACECCRLISDAISSEEGRAALQLAELFADGMTTNQQMAAASARAHAQTMGPSGTAAAESQREAIRAAAYAASPTKTGVVHAISTVEAAWLMARGLSTNAQREMASAVLCPIVRDVFANPFRTVEFNPKWQSADVVDLANAIYADRAFDRMPILGDALMDAGCDNEDIIQHCRGPGPHVRGCWVVDLILGRNRSPRHDQGRGRGGVAVGGEGVV